MQCPECGNENPDDAQVCKSCSSALATRDTQQSKQKAKTGVMVVCAAGLAGLSCILAILIKPTLAFLAALFGFCSAIAAIAKFLRSERKAKRTTIAIGIVVLIFSSLQMLILTYWRIDAAPIPNDYTINDIRSAAPEYNQTYTLLNSLSDDNDDATDALAIGLSKEDLKNLEEINNIFKEDDLRTISEQLQANADNILSIWQNAKKGRDVLVKLDSFPEIADLTVPKLEIDVPFAPNLRRLAFLHRSYVCLQSSKGNHENVINELTRCDSIFKKMSLNAHSLITRLVCIACFAIDIQTTNFIINNPETPHELLWFLKQHIVPFSEEHTSLRNSMIFEYLICKNELTKISNDPRLRHPIFSPLKLNSALRLYRNICDKWIAIEENRTHIKELRVWPALYPNLPVKIDSEGKLPWYYKIYNPVGAKTIAILTPAMDRVISIRTRLEVHSDLLQILLNKRLGREVSLKARAYSDEYIVDTENRKIFSPGPDGRINTKDDIKLRINPDVLGWRN